MSEKDTLTRYGLVESRVAETIPKPPARSGLFVRVFEPNEDSQWRTGVLMEKSRTTGRSPRSVFSDEAVDTLDAQIAEAREKGQVPVRVVGPADAVPQFLGRAGITQASLVN